MCSKHGTRIYALPGGEWEEQPNISRFRCFLLKPKTLDSAPFLPEKMPQNMAWL